MTKEELAELLKRYQQGTCTATEKRLIERLHLYSHDPKAAPSDDLVKDEIWQNIEAHTIGQKRKNHRPVYSAAAAIILLIGVYFLYHYMRPSAAPSAKQHMVDIPAGGNRATLKLSNGKRITLDSLNAGISMHATVLSYLNGVPVPGQRTNEDQSLPTFHELETPKGGQYQLMLADGTKVWLNAASSIRFPSSFSKDLREVTISGEVYFEIAQDKNHPFRVKTKNQHIQVLGTSFNVQAYPDEAVEHTTLVSGKIKIEREGFSEIIYPGHRASIATEGVTISEVDTDETTAWRSGFISFNEQTLADIMRQISRWYNVSISYQQVDPSLRFGGRVSRYANVSEVLRRLELTEQVRFKIDERRIVVTKY